MPSVCFPVMVFKCDALSAGFARCVSPHFTRWSPPLWNFYFHSLVINLYIVFLGRGAFLKPVILYFKNQRSGPWDSFNKAHPKAE